MKSVQSWVRGSTSGMKSLLIGAFVLASFAGQAGAQNNGGVGQVFLTAPALAAAGEHVLLCVANVSGLTVPTAPPNGVISAADPPATTETLTVTLNILNGVTGAVLSSTQVTLPPLGSAETPPDPCLEFVVAPATLAGANNSFIGEVLLNPQPLPPRAGPPGVGACFPPDPCGKVLTTSLQIYTPDANGNPASVRVIGFEPPDPCLQATGSDVCKVQVRTHRK